MLANLVRLPEHRIGLATGGWSASARIKLLSAAIAFDAYPSATSDDAKSKAEVMSIALERVCAAHRCTEPTSVVYVGDSRWDAMASRKLNIPFIGIGSAEHAELLHDEGAIEVLPDYANLIAVGAALSSAQRAYRRESDSKKIRL
jgi:phosphoglycolate phosphatase-like HAD superfamily hydrolase